MSERSYVGTPEDSPDSLAARLCGNALSWTDPEPYPFADGPDGRADVLRMIRARFSPSVAEEIISWGMPNDEAVRNDGE